MRASTRSSSVAPGKPSRSATDGCFSRSRTSVGRFVWKWRSLRTFSRKPNARRKARYSDADSSPLRMSASIFGDPKFSRAFQRMVWKSRKPPIPFLMLGSCM